jgi:AcrR family transcriptional regulator
MTSVVTNGSLGAGTGPISLSTAFSDRAGEEAPGQSGPAPLVEPLDRVLRNLDSLAEPATVGLSTELRTAQGPEDHTEEAPTAGEPSRRETILDAASALFAERGYHGASLRDISRRVGISHPGMLHHFSSKEVLLGAVIDRLEAHAQGLLDSVEAISATPTALLAALGGPWDPRKHSMALLATLSAEVVNPDHPGRYRIARLRLVHEHVLEKVFHGLGEAGHLVEGASPKFLARSLFSLLLSLTVREHTVRELQRTGDADPIGDVEEFVQLCCTEG